MTISAETLINDSLELLVILSKFQVVSAKYRTTYGRTRAATERMLSLLHELRDVMAAFELTDEHICHINKSMDEVARELQKPPVVESIGTVN